jgi:Zn-dependent peptidase ImmA (M78 family)
MHEIGHVMLHLSKNQKLEFVDYSKEEIVNKSEAEANKFAQTKLIPPKVWNDIIENHSLRSPEKIKNMGDLHCINSAIILGRAKFEANKYDVRKNIDMSLK